MCLAKNPGEVALIGKANTPGDFANLQMACMRTHQQTFCCGNPQAQLLTRSVDDRLAASGPFLCMVATAVAGWLVERSAALHADESRALEKKATSAFYLDQIVPEASGMMAAALADCSHLYALSAEQLA